MTEYIFIFGRDPELSFLELKAYFHARNISYTVLSHSEFGAIFELKNFKPAFVIGHLAGTVKIAEVVKDLEKAPLYTGEKNKLMYAVSAYEADPGEMRSYLKQRLKKEKYKAMFKQAQRKDPYLAPSETQRVLKEGFEVVLFKKSIGFVVAVYDPDAYRKRDIGKPVQRPLHTISIRLAKFLVNLSEAKKGDILIDPFCGIGVILQEALLMGIKVVGVDRNSRCVQDSLKNLNWTKEQFGITSKVKVTRGDSRSLGTYVKKGDALATEPYMGPFLKKLPTREKALTIVKGLIPQYADLLKEIHLVVQGKSAIIVPRFRLYDGKRIKVPFQRLLDQAGLKALPGYPVTYVAIKSRIEREIWVVERV